MKTNEAENPWGYPPGVRGAWKERRGLAFSVFLALTCTSASANLLRNATFQDDWVTLLPENQNHHWCYGTGFQNRRDYNPDGWFFSGSWEWMNASLPRGSRRVILKGPRAEARQRVNWVFVHDDRKKEGFPDAGGFPAPALQRSSNPLRLLRDLTLRVRVRGDHVRSGGGSVELGLAPPGPISAWGDGLSSRPEELARTRIEVSGLRAGGRVKVLFEDRELIAQAGFFVDDFRGRDLYQRFGGGPGVGYGRDSVALHIYEIP